MRPGLSGMGARATLPRVRGIGLKVSSTYQPIYSKPLQAILVAVLATHTTATRCRAPGKMPTPVIALPIMVRVSYRLTQAPYIGTDDATPR
jgi:hypothetical protein